MSELLKEILDNALIVVAPAEYVIQRGEAVSLACFFLMVKLLRFEFVVADHTPIVVGGVHRKTRRECAIDTDNH